MWKDKNRQKEYRRKYYESHKKQARSWHDRYYDKNKELIKSKSRKYTKNNKENIKKQKRTYYLKYKMKFLDMYGHGCSCCGESHMEFLTIEHKNGQKGIKNRKGGAWAYLIALREYRPDLYEVLCMNCNFSKGKYGYCPHKQSTSHV